MKKIDKNKLFKKEYVVNEPPHKNIPEHVKTWVEEKLVRDSNVSSIGLITSSGILDKCEEMRCYKDEIYWELIQKAGVVDVDYDDNFTVHYLPDVIIIGRRHI